MSELGKAFAQDREIGGIMPSNAQIGMPAQLPSEKRLAYHEAILDAMNQPVLRNPARRKAEAAAEMLRATGVEGGFIARFESQYVDSAPVWITPNEYVSQLQIDSLDPSMVAGALSGVREGDLESRGRNFKAEVAAQIASTQMLDYLRQHMPGGPLAELEMERQSDFDARPGGDPVAYGFGGLGRKNVPNEAESQNIQARRVFDLFQANVGDRGQEGVYGPYLPASAGSQALRAVGGAFSLFNPANTLDESLQPFDEKAQISQPDGQLAYAVEYYNRGRPDEETGRSPPIYDGSRHNYSHESPMTVEGFGRRLVTDPKYPLAWGAGYLAPNRHLLDQAGMNSGGRDSGEDMDVIRELRTKGRQGIAPDSVRDLPAYKQLVDADRNAEGNADSWVSSEYARYFGQYPSMFTEGAMNVPTEMVSDMGNAAVNVVQYGVPAAGIPLKFAAGGSKTLIPSIKSFASGAIRNAGDDLLEETVIEGGPAALALGGVSMFTPQENISIMGDTKADDPDYEEKQRDANIDRVSRIIDNTRQFKKLTGKQQ